VKEDPEKVQERLTSFLHTACSTPVSARVARHEDPRGWVHWIEVPKQRGLEPMQFKGRVWVRRSRSSVQPSPAELQELNNTFGYILTEGQYIRAAGARDIDLAAFRSYLKALGLETDEEPQPAPEDDLTARGVLAESNGDLPATLYGVLAFGKEPQRFLQTQSFWVECVAYQGCDRASDVFLAGEAKGRLDEQVTRAVGWVRSLGRFERYHGLIRTDVPLVPEAVLREAVVNAVAHRDYAVSGSKILLEVFGEDRLVVTSPGSLPNHMTPRSVLAGGHPRSRNELMANYLLAMGQMEQRGRGWPVMRRRMRELNGTEPQLHVDVDAPFVRVTLALKGPHEHAESA
jgi:ATP-dependent DNA helicase RecG